MTLRHLVVRPLALMVVSLAGTMLGCARGQATSTAVGADVRASGSPRVGPATGSVLVVGGGANGPEIFAKFIELAGGPDALIVEVPTAGGDSIDVSTVGRGLRAAGARNVVVLHTTSRVVADADSFVAKVANARGVWFGGGRHYRLVDSYMDTRTQRAFEAVLARGGVVGGSSAGASILSSYLIRGAPSNNNRIMNHPQYLKGFGYLRNVAIDQHVVARERLADLHDSVTSKRADLLGISEDEGTAWLVRGDVGEIIGRNKAFVYGGRDANDAGKPFLTLHPGDRYDLASRKLIARAIDATPLTQRFIDSLVASYGQVGGGITLLVAQDGRVLVNRAYGVPTQRRYMPETAMPNVPLLGLSPVLNAAFGTQSARPTTATIARVTGIGGMQRARYDSSTGTWQANVDDLYRFELARTALLPGAPDTASMRAGFATDTLGGRRRQVAFALPGGKRGAWVRFPDQRTVMIVLTADDTINADAITQRIAEQLFARR